MPIKPGDTLGPYEIVAELGRGGMATVFRARQPSMTREVAIKVLPEQFLHDPNFLNRFVNEARVIAQLEHRGILPVYDFGQVEGVPYIVMRLMPHGSLRSRLRASGPFTPADAARAIAQVAEALDFAHARGVIHRDLKPDNVLLDEQGNAYLSDFGIAKVIEATAQTSGSMMVGTPNYMSPEQARGQKASAQSDIYALGAVTFELLTARPPFQADDIIALLFKHANDPVPSMRDLNPAVTDSIQAVVEKAMAKNPGDRYTTARDLAADLDRALRGELPSATVFEAPRPTPPTPTMATRTVTEVPPPKVLTPTPPAAAAPIPPAPAVAPRPEPQAKKGGAGLRIGLGAAGCLILSVAAVAVALAGGLGTGLFGGAGATATLPLTPTKAVILEPTHTSAPHATDTPTPSIEVVSLDGRWTGRLVETIGDKREFDAALSVKQAQGSAEFVGSIVTVAADGSIKEGYDIQGNMEGARFFFSESNGRHYWGKVSGDHLKGLVAWNCFECDPWGEFELARDSAGTSGGATTGAAILFSDDFSSNANGWYEGAFTNELGEETYTVGAGIYKAMLTKTTERGFVQIVIPKASPYVADFVLTVDVLGHKGDGSYYYGLVFRAADPGHYYTFQIGQDGNYIVLLYTAEAGFKFLTDFATDPAIVPSKPNQLSVRAQGPEMIFSVNGKELAVVNDATIEEGQVGVWVAQGDGQAKQTSVVDFDNFTLQEP